MAERVTADGTLVLVYATAAVLATVLLAFLLHRLLSPRVSARRGSWLRRERPGTSVGRLWPGNSLLPATPPRAGQFEELEAAEELLASLPALRKNPSYLARLTAASAALTPPSLSHTRHTHK